MTLTPASIDALAKLRIWPAQFHWYLIPLFAFVVYVYAQEIERKNFDKVFAGLAFWAMDWLNEIINGVILHVTNYSALWTVGGDSGYVILVGLNIEISLMFAMAGIGFSKMLLEDKHLKIFGVNNRILFAIGNSIFCVIVEVVLNSAGALLWAYSFWNKTFFGLGLIPIVIFGYLTFMLVAFWVHDMEALQNKIKVVGSLGVLDIVLLIFFIGINWI